MLCQKYDLNFVIMLFFITCIMFIKINIMFIKNIKDKNSYLLIFRPIKFNFVYKNYFFDYVNL